MSELHTHRLDGCAPTPLASYLKALGVLRLLATPANNVKNEAADSSARGWWAGERFHVRTRLGRDALLRFFLEDYAPSPIIAPWNGGSGFYYREGKTGEKDAITGKMVKTGVRDAPTEATRRIDTIAASSSLRFGPLAEAIKNAKAVIAEFGLAEAPENKAGRKAAFIARYRSFCSEQATDWVDAALAVAGQQFDSAALLGSGGNDGNLDFSTTFQAAVLDVIDPETGGPRAEAAAALHWSLFERTMTGAFSAGISQLAPGNIGAANSGNGFSGTERGDPWSIILMFEGAIAFAGTATRRAAANRARGSFPFTVSQLASGSGAVGGEDDSSSRAAELWLPIWEWPTRLAELRALLGEGRAHLGRREASDGLTFARAVAALGVSRGVTEFERLGFEARYGNMFITIPLGRFRTPDRPRHDLIADLDVGGWLSRVRRLARERNAPARARAAVRRFEDALFDITREDRRRDGLQAALAALGSLVSWLATSGVGREKVAPPPLLGRGWVIGADDGTPEFRVAAALASVGWPEDPKQPERKENGGPTPGPAGDAEGRAPAAARSSEGGTVIRTAGIEVIERKAPPPMAAHFAAMDEKTIGRRSRSWAENDSASVVWGAGGLVGNMVAVLERRLLELTIRGLDDKPLAGVAPPRLGDIGAFLEGPPVFDDARCAALVAGLVWARPARLPQPGYDAPVPFTYAALKPIFTPDDELREKPSSEGRQAPILPPHGRLPVPPGLVALLRRGAVDEAVRTALSRARASGLGSPFDLARSPTGAMRFGAGVKAERLAAALLIPIDHRALRRLVARAYAEPLPMEDTDDAA